MDVEPSRLNQPVLALPSRPLCLIMASSAHGVAPKSEDWATWVPLQLDPQEAAAVQKINEIPMGFTIWSRGRREDSNGPKKTLPVEQPAKILPDVNLFIGDIDDSWDVEKLKTLNIKSVVNLCSERFSCRYSGLPARLAGAAIDQLVLCADDSWRFDIIPVAERACRFIKGELARGDGGVLVHCYGGVNRYGAVCAAYLATELSIPLREAVQRLRQVRETALQNEMFIQQLVRHCSWK